MAVLASGGREAVTPITGIKPVPANIRILNAAWKQDGPHQIRVHMASLGHPLLGDAVYGPAKCPYKLQGQTLHAGVLGFHHPEQEHIWNLRLLYRIILSIFWKF